MTSSFNIVSFAEQGAMDVVYMETPFARWLEDEEDAARHTAIFDRIARHSLTQHDSGTLIDGIRREM